MNLLPKTHQEFAQTEYWDTFFKKRGDKAFEWYGEYLELCSQLHKYIKNKDKILMVGCGNSKLSMDLYDSGFKDLTNIDISQIVIKQMLDINKKSRPDMKFIQMDATKMDFLDEEFSVVLDKGTLDALMTDDSEGVKETVRKYFQEICRVLKNGGRYVCISLLQEHILKFLIDYFPSNNCMLRIVRCYEAEQKNAETSKDGTTMPVFVIVSTKFKNLPLQVLEVSLDGEKMQRLQNPADLLEAVTSVQKAALVCNGLNRTSIAGSNEVVIDLYKPGAETPRYTVYVLDQSPNRENGKYAAFIVPQGREVEWLFSTPQGRRKLLASAHRNRLAIVTLQRDQNYVSWDEVKTELAESIRNLAPHGMTDQIPYLSLGCDVGKREIIESGKSEMSGDYVIEEVEGHDGKIFRRLIFLSNQSVVQSEALVKIIKPKNKPARKKIDLGYLACQHHLYMTAGVSLVTKNDLKKQTNVLVIGLGGGGLCTFIHEVLRNVNITAVEIDPVMLDVAKNFFELKEDDRLKVEIDDGLNYLVKSVEKGQHFDAILFDVDSKDLSLGMSCPPKCFLESEILNAVKALIQDNGLFVLNLVCRDENLREEAINNLKSSFNSICSYRLEEDLNEIVYCKNNSDLKTTDDWKKALTAPSKQLNQLIKKCRLSKDDMLDVNDFLRELKI